MGILNVINSFLAKREGLKEYDMKIRKFLEDEILSPEEEKELDEIVSKFSLKKEDLLAIHKSAVSGVFKNISADSRITDDEKESLEELLTHFGLETKDIDFNQKAFNKYYALALIDKGILPKVGKHDLSVRFKGGEILHFGQDATLRKMKRVTHRVNYGGLVASVKIVKGLRYRVGSINFKTESSNVATIEDTGIFYLTDQRVGFMGNFKQFTIPYEKISSFELKPEGLYIFKEGKEAPYIVDMEDYEVALSIVSHFLNQD